MWTKLLKYCAMIFRWSVWYLTRVRWENSSRKKKYRNVYTSTWINLCSLVDLISILRFFSAVFSARFCFSFADAQVQSLPKRYFFWFSVFHCCFYFPRFGQCANRAIMHSVMCLASVSEIFHFDDENTAEKMHLRSEMKVNVNNSEVK